MEILTNTSHRVPTGFRSVDRIYTEEATIVQVGRRLKPETALRPGMKVLVDHHNKLIDLIDDEPTHEILYCIENQKCQGLVLQELETDGECITIYL